MMVITHAEGNRFKDISRHEGMTIPHSSELSYQTQSPLLEWETTDESQPAVDDSNTDEGVGDLFELATVISELNDSLNLMVPDELVSQGERGLALIFTLRGCKDYSSMLGAVFLYCTSNYGESVTKRLRNYIGQLLRTMAQTGPEAEVKEDLDPNWITILRSCKDNWNLVKHNSLFGQFSKLLGILVVANLCEASSVTLEIGKFKLIEPDLELVHKGAMNLADAALSTVMYFVENIYASWKTGDLRPLLLGSQEAIELDEEYSRAILWWDLVKNGNLKKVTGKSDAEFDRLLESLSTKLRNLMATKKNSFEKKIVSDKFQKLLGIKNDYITLKLSSGVRKAPFCIEFFGESSQGKTTCADQVVDALLASAGLPLGKEYRASVNAGDKYMSNWCTNKTVMQFDDMANEASNFVERPPTRMIIDVCNNQPFYANMADLDSKGKVFVEPEIVTVSTNKKNLDAGIYSNCPYSIQRRMHNVITVRAKEEFQFIVDGRPQGIDAAKVRASYETAGRRPVFDDIWLLTVERAVQPAKLTTVAPYKVVQHNGKDLKDISMRELIQFLIHEYKTHRDNQEVIVDTMRERQEIELCPEPGCCNIRGCCDAHDAKYPQLGEEIVDWCHRKYRGVRSTCQFIYASVDESVSRALLVQRDLDWLRFMPSSLVGNRLFAYAMAPFYTRRLVRHYTQLTVLNAFLAITMSLMSCWHFDFESAAVCLLIVWINAITFQKSLAKHVITTLHDELVGRNSLSPLMEAARARNVRYVCATFAIIGGVYVFAKVYRAWCRCQTQGSLEPKTMEDILKRDSESSPWTQVAQRPLPVSKKSLTSVSEHLQGSVLNNLHYGTLVHEGKNLMVNGLFIKSNAVLIPTHYFDGVEEFAVTFRRQNPEATAGKFATRLSKRAAVQIPDTDLTLCYSSTGGSMRNLCDYFPTGVMPQREFAMFWRKKDGTVKEFHGLTNPKRTSNGAVQFEGGDYASLSDTTFKGLCGATLVSKGKGPSILGFHLGGVAGTPRGCYGMLTQKQINDALTALAKCEGVVISGDGHDFRPHVLDVNIMTDKPMHPKSPLNYMPENSQVAYHGGCKGASTTTTDVKVTPISEHVTDVCGVPNKWGPPKIHPQWFGWQTCLSNLAVPALPFEYKLLEAAIKDYKEDLLMLFRSELWKDTRPLTDEENMMGIAGKKFVDGVNLSTSIGFPLSGPKRNFIIESVDPEGNLRREFVPQIMDEIKYVRSRYAQGERAYTIAKACPKDEVLSKPKQRIFYSSPLPLSFNMRGKFLPLLRVMQMNPLVSECAVGINSHGPEWEEFHNFVMKYGPSRIIGGDYGAYDQKLPAQLLFAALRILIDCAREVGYPEEDIREMEAMSGDIVYALIAFNGDLIGLTEGTHISGTSLTVFLNGISNSLNLRCHFYEQYPFEEFAQRKKFRDYVSLMTYGDDNIGSVHPSIDRFNIKSISRFLGRYGQTYTMPDKESELVEFLPVQDFEFLKRKSVWHPELDIHLGALADASCFKMLHCFMRPKGTDITEEHACGMNIDTALREWFNHGRDHYERRRQEMKTVARRAGIEHLCTQLDVTYDERLDAWRTKYLGEQERETIDPFFGGYEIQCGSETEVEAVDLYGHCINPERLFYAWEEPFTLFGFALFAIWAFCMGSRLCGFDHQRVPRAFTYFLLYDFVLIATQGKWHMVVRHVVSAIIIAFYYTMFWFIGWCFANQEW